MLIKTKILIIEVTIIRLTKIKKKDKIYMEKIKVGEKYVKNIQYRYTNKSIYRNKRI